LGSKNRILLGIITSLILHNIRNIFSKQELYITKNKYNKVLQKHPEIQDILHNNFQIVLDNTFATCNYDKDGLYNFISHYEDKYIIFSISTNNFYTEVATIFYANKRILKKCSNSIKFINENHKEKFVEFIT